MKLLRIFLTISLTLAASAAFAQAPASITLGTESFMIAPSRGIASAPAYTNGQAASQGAYRSSNGRFYWAKNAGVTTNAPTHLYGDSTDDNIVWQYLSVTRPRRGIVVVNLTTNVIYLSFEGPAVVGKGVTLLNERAVLLLDQAVPNTAMYGISSDSSTNAAISIQEW